MHPFAYVFQVLAGIPAEDRPHFKRIDASQVRHDDGAWLLPNRLTPR
jgi:hypothetical protein